MGEADQVLPERLKDVVVEIFHEHLEPGLYEKAVNDLETRLKLEPPDPCEESNETQAA